MANSHLIFQCLLGMQCEGFTIVAADQMNIQSVIVMKDDDDKLIEITDKLIIGVNGDPADTTQFTQYVQKNLSLYEMRNGYQLEAPAIVHFTRKSVSDSLRDGLPRIINMLIAGHDSQGCHLYTMDFLASCVRVPYAAHGLAGLLAISILAENYRPNLTEIEAYRVIQLCVAEIQKRLCISLPNFQVKSVSKNGVRVLPAIRPDSLAVK